MASNWRLTWAFSQDGGTGKHRDVQKATFELTPDEFLTGITVEFWQYIDRITFHTNQSNYGPYGGHGGLLKKTLEVRRRRDRGFQRTPLGTGG